MTTANEYKTLNNLRKHVKYFRSRWHRAEAIPIDTEGLLKFVKDISPAEELNIMSKIKHQSPRYLDGLIDMTKHLAPIAALIHGLTLTELYQGRVSNEVEPFYNTILNDLGLEPLKWRRNITRMETKLKKPVGEEFRNLQTLFDAYRGYKLKQEDDAKSKGFSSDDDSEQPPSEKLSSEKPSSEEPQQDEEEPPLKKPPIRSPVKMGQSSKDEKPPIKPPTKPIKKETTDDEIFKPAEPKQRKPVADLADFFKPPKSSSDDSDEIFKTTMNMFSEPVKNELDPTDPDFDPSKLPPLELKYAKQTPFPPPMKDVPPKPSNPEESWWDAHKRRFQEKGKEDKDNYLEAINVWDEMEKKRLELLKQERMEAIRKGYKFSDANLEEKTEMQRIEQLREQKRKQRQMQNENRKVPDKPQPPVEPPGVPPIEPPGVPLSEQIEEPPERIVPQNLIVKQEDQKSPIESITELMRNLRDTTSFYINASLDNYSNAIDIINNFYEYAKNTAEQAKMYSAALFSAPEDKIYENMRLFLDAYRLMFSESGYWDKVINGEPDMLFETHVIKRGRILGSDLIKPSHKFDDDESYIDDDYFDDYGQPARTYFTVNQLLKPIQEIAIMFNNVALSKRMKALELRTPQLTIDKVFTAVQIMNKNPGAQNLLTFSNNVDVLTKNYFDKFSDNTIDSLLKTGMITREITADGQEMFIYKNTPLSRSEVLEAVKRKQLSNLTQSRSIFTPLQLRNMTVADEKKTKRENIKQHRVTISKTKREKAAALFNDNKPPLGFKLNPALFKRNF